MKKYMLFASELEGRALNYAVDQALGGYSEQQSVERSLNVDYCGNWTVIGGILDSRLPEFIGGESSLMAELDAASRVNQDLKSTACRCIVKRNLGYSIAIPECVLENYEVPQ